MAVNWQSFASEINTGVLKEMGKPIVITVKTETKSKTGTGKKIITTKDYKGIAVMGAYGSEFETKQESIIHAGDLKFIVQFNDKAFEPSEKLNETITFGGKQYTVISVKVVAPDGINVAVFVIQARRIA